MSDSIMNAVISGITSIVSGMILWIIQTQVNSVSWWVIIGVAVLLGASVYLVIFVYRCKSLGISKVLPSSIKGEGSTTAYMESATSNICFVGIAASKWVLKGDILEKTIRKICSLNSGYIKFLLLDPKSEAARKLSLAGRQNEDQVGKKIEDSIASLNKILKRLRTDYSDAIRGFEIRLYDQMPIFRLAIIDNRRAYFCFYQLGCDGSELKQFVIKPKQHENPDVQNIFNSMTEYFDCLWNAPTTKTYTFTEE